MEIENLLIIDPEAEAFYDRVYDLVDRYLKKRNVCGFTDGRCVGRMLTATCCVHCDNLSSIGCSTKNIFCKFYLCPMIQGLYPHIFKRIGTISRIFWKVLSEKFGLSAGWDVGPFQSKKYILDNLKRKGKDY